MIEVGEIIEAKPGTAYTLTVTTRSGQWVHHVNADGEPAGGVFCGTPYNDISELFTDGVDQ
jgi:hypothetical protein